ncbi:MAG: GAF domain-containing protein [Ferruginibacter sp.]
MQQKLINMMEDGDERMHIVTDTHLSFKPFLDNLRKRTSDGETIKKEMLEFILAKFSMYPELEQNVPFEDLSKYKSLFDLLYITLTSIIDEEKKMYWALCVPMSPIMFYGSDPFYEMLDEADKYDDHCGLTEEEVRAFKAKKLEHFYSYILKHFYDIQFSGSGSIIRSMVDPQTGITRHFRLNLNTDFVEVTPKKPLPKVDLALMRNYVIYENAVQQFQEILPVDMFSFSGFTVMTITDVTSESALDAIRDNIVKTQIDSESVRFTPVEQSLKELAGSSDIELNILPIYKVNDKLVEDQSIFNHSILFTSLRNFENAEKLCLSLIEQFANNPKLIYFGDLETEGPSQQDIGEAMLREGIKSYVLYPIMYNHNLVGAIEVYSKKKDVINEKLLSRLDPAKELMAQLVQNNITRFNEKVDSVIKEKFTNLQPSVQWKFNEAAWHYIQQESDPASLAEPEAISFENVYPLYGAVDIRNSTIERNFALRKDLQVQFDVLTKVLNTLKEKTGFGLLDEKIFAVKKWSELLGPANSLLDQEIKLNDFFENDITTFLRMFTSQDTDLENIAKEYFEAIDEQHGIAYENRRQLELSMSTVIGAVNTYFDKFKEDIQQAYPCYFEKFRTDGVEYDIYIGQSITPDKPYSNIYLKNLRLMQLSSMAAVARFSNQLLPQLPTPVETTQLIFIHSNPIDILFRRDEKRFDVEGAYNIRYHIIKKRIDKVHLKGSGERLTQPGKIALVYFNQKEADEYIAYIKYLQGEKILLDDLEQLELEELQGVSGLKALRVSVALDA